MLEDSQWFSPQLQAGMGQDWPRTPGGLYINSGDRLEVPGEGKDPNPTDCRLVVFASFLQSGSELGMVDKAAVGPGPHVRQRGRPAAAIHLGSEAPSSSLQQQLVPGGPG